MFYILITLVALTIYFNKLIIKFFYNFYNFLLLHIYNLKNNIKYFLYFKNDLKYFWRRNKFFNFGSFKQSYFNSWWRNYKIKQSWIWKWRN